jgi:hypothetical protein
VGRGGVSNSVFPAQMYNCGPAFPCSLVANNARLNNQYSAVSDGAGGIFVRCEPYVSTPSLARALDFFSAAAVLIIMNYSDFGNNAIRRRSASGIATTSCK